MNESNPEHLSCLMDDELDARGARFLVRRLGSDSGMIATWRRYHYMRAAIQGEGPLDTDLVGRVAGVIDNDPVQSSERGPRSLRWLRPVAGGAIAAAVAVVALVGLQNQPVPGGAEPAGVADTTPDSGEGFVSRENGVLNRPFTQQPVPVGLNPQRSDTSKRSRLNSYLLRHNQMAGSAGAAGFVSYVPIVTSRGARAERTAVNEDAATSRQPEPATRD